jgi:chromosome partitioning protein
LNSPIAAAAAAATAVKAGAVAPLARPGRTRIFTVSNQKGGVGKTTSAVNLAAALAIHGQNVLVIDCDPQGNASTALGVDHRVGTPDTYEVLVEDRPLVEVVVATPDIPRLWCAPATIDLAGAEVELVGKVAREHRLRRALAEYLPEHERLHGRLDYVFIDCPPSLGQLTLNALVAAEEVLLPIQCEYYALEGVTQLTHTIDLVRRELNPPLRVTTVLLTMYDARTNLSSQVADEVRRVFGRLVLATQIPRSVRLSEAPSYGQTVLSYDPGSPGALAYLDAAREVAQGQGAIAVQHEPPIHNAVPPLGETR